MTTTRPARIVRLTKGPNWWWTRYVLEGTRLRPGFIWQFWKAGDSVEFLAESYEISVDEAQACIAWCERRSEAGKRAAATRKGRRSA